MSLFSCSFPTFRSVFCNSVVLSNIQLLIPNLQLCGIALFWSSFTLRIIIKCFQKSTHIIFLNTALRIMLLTLSWMLWKHLS
jgi:hypothetical protein